MARFYLQRKLYAQLLADYRNKRSKLWKLRGASASASLYARLFWLAHDHKDVSLDAAATKYDYTVIRAGHDARAGKR